MRDREKNKQIDKMVLVNVYLRACNIACLYDTMWMSHKTPWVYKVKAERRDPLFIPSKEEL